MTPDDLREWIPAAVRWDEGRPWVGWCHLGQERLLDPFFEQTVLRRSAASSLEHRSTSIDELGELVAARPGLAPAGFVFHLSRCGSTAFSQMLAALPQNVVLSEPPPLDPLVRLPLRNDVEVTEDQQIVWLRWMMAALGQRRHPDERHLFVKLDSWHTRALPLLRRAFPTVPIVFMYRDPVEVLVSQLRRPGHQMMPSVVSPNVYGIDLLDVFQMSRETYGARVLAAIAETALAQRREGALRLLSYEELPDGVPALVSGHFGVPLSASDRAKMMEAATRDAKNPGAAFTADASAKQREASESVRAACALWTKSTYDALESLRLAERG